MPIVIQTIGPTKPPKLKTVPLTMKIAIIGGISLSILMSIFISNLINFFKEYDV